MAVPKKCTSIYIKNVFVEIFGRKKNLAAIKAFSLAKSASTGDSKSFFAQQTTGKKILE